MAHTEHANPHAHGPHAGHETTDTTLDGAGRFMVVVALFLAVCFGLMWILMGQLNRREAALDVKPSPVVVRQGDRLPPLPRLQTLPVQELAAFRRSEDRVLQHWGWSDTSRTLAHVPVSRAIELAAERGLPVPPPVATPAAPAASTAPVPVGAPAR